MQKLFLVLLLVSLPLAAQAQTVALSDTVSVLDQLKTLPLKEGFMWNIPQNRGANTLSLGVLGYNGISLDLTWIGIDGLGTTLDYNLSNLPIKNVPVLSYLQYLNIGYTVGYRTLALNPTTGNPKDDNKFIHGPTVFLKFKF